MNCPRCGSQMSGGAPHCETIKVQMECQCGHIETELYSPDEQKLNELVAATEVDYQLCREALEKHGYDLEKATRQILTNSFRELCRISACEAEEFAKHSKFRKIIADLSDDEIKELSGEGWLYALNSPDTILD
jgi:hypothetical protein